MNVSGLLKKMLKHDRITTRFSILSLIIFFFIFGIREIHNVYDSTGMNYAFQVSRLEISHFMQKE